MHSIHQNTDYTTPQRDQQPHTDFRPLRLHLWIIHPANAFCELCTPPSFLLYFFPCTHNCSQYILNTRQIRPIKWLINHNYFPWCICREKLICYRQLCVKWIFPFPKYQPFCSELTDFRKALGQLHHLQIKEMVYPKIMSWITQVVANLYKFLYPAEHKEIWKNVSNLHIWGTTDYH